MTTTAAMSDAKIAVLCVLAIFASVTSARQLLQAGGCPINPAQQDLDFTGVAASCGDASTICGTCICALVDVFTPALVAGGVSVNTSDPSSFPLDKSADIIRQCAEQYLVSMLMANVNVTALANLSECSFNSSGDVPACLATQVADIKPGVKNTVFMPDLSTGTAADANTETDGDEVAESTNTPTHSTVTATAGVDSAAVAAAPKTAQAAPAQAAPTSVGNSASARDMSIMAGPVTGALLLVAMLL